MEMNFTVAHFKAKPWLQAAIALCIAFAGMLLCRILHAEGGKEYFAALIAIIFFTIINTVVSLGNKSWLKYTVPSYYLYIALVIILFLSAKTLSGVSIWKLNEYRMMLISITIFYLMASLMVRLLRFLFEAAESDY